MPCNDGYSTRSYEDTARVNLNARVACSALSLLTEAQVRKLPLESQIWWNAHQEADRIREAREAEARHKQELRDSARAKLSPDEIKALNL